MVTNIKWQKEEAHTTCANIDHWHSLSQPHIPPLPSKTSPQYSISVYTFRPLPIQTSCKDLDTVKVNGEGHYVQKVKDNQRLAERVHLFARGTLKRWLEADFLLPIFCFRLNSGRSRISPRWGANPPGIGNARFCQTFPKTTWNWKNLDTGASLGPPLHPPMRGIFLLGIEPRRSSSFGHNRNAIRRSKDVFVRLKRWSM